MEKAMTYGDIQKWRKEIMKEPIKQVFEETVRTGIGQRGEFRFLLNDGSVRFIESQGSVIKDDKGKVVKVLVVSRDVTERRRAEEELRRSEKRFRALIENSSDAIALLSPAGLVLYAGPSTERILGHANEDFVGSKVFELIHPEDRERTISLLNGLAQNPGHAVRIECRVRHKDGSWRVIEAIANNQLADPAVAGVIITGRDITKRNADEEELLASQERYRELFENANDMLYTHDKEGRLTSVNQTGERLLQRSRVELL